MKSLTVCESTFVEQKEESKVLKEKGNEKVNLKKNLRSSSKNQKLINVIENSEGDVKCPAVEEDCLEEIDKKFNRNSKTDTVANISGEGGKANSDLNDSTFISSHKNTNTICIKKPEKASNSKTVVVKPKVNNEEFVQVLVEKSFCEKKKEEKNSSKDEGENGEHVTDESKESRDILEVDKSQPKTEKDNELCESVVDLQNVLFPKKQNCLDNDCSSFEEVPIAENSQAVETMILDTDENKENEKLSKSAVIEGFSMTSEEALGSSSKCEIQVGECQTISDSEKESIWTKTESEKPFAPLAKPYSGDSEETPNVKPGKISLGSPKSKEVLLSSEQQQEQEENEETHIVIDSEENGAEGMEFEVEETDHSNSELNSENMEQKPTSTIVTISEKETNSENNDNKTIKVRVDLKNTQKRQLEQNEDYRSAKRKKLEHIEEVEIDVNEENKNGHNSSLNDSSSVHKVGVSLREFLKFSYYILGIKC